MLKKWSMFLLAAALFSPGLIYANSELIVGGDTIGIEVDYDGVMVTGTYTISQEDGMYDPSQTFQKGDIIKSVNGTDLHSLQELYAIINTFQNNVNDIPCEIERNDQRVSVVLRTIFDSSTNSYKSGLYVKDKITGVGTITYYDPANQSYGALGHEIMDTDLQEIADIENGSIYSSDVTSITKAQSQIAGEKHATIDYNDLLGDIQKNTTIGIYGNYQKKGTNSLQLEWADKEEITTGPAQIYTVLNGNEIRAYDIELTKVHDQSMSSIKGIEFTITDPVIIEKTNGIVQGMSGSPIVQNNKIIGAVTHVVLSDPMQGYGVFIEWMLQESNSL